MGVFHGELSLSFYDFDLEKSGGKIARNRTQNRKNNPNNPKANPYQGTGFASIKVSQSPNVGENITETFFYTRNINK